MKLLLHCCCAPCSVSCVSSLRHGTQGIEPQLFWYSPNIHPYTEYLSRRDSLIQFAQSENLKLTMIDEYALHSFLDAVFPQTRARCQKCYVLRLEKAASVAAQEGFEAFTTTLLISPYQDHEAIRRIGEEAGAKYGIEFLYRDFRPLFGEGQAKARAAGFYMQKYCGCVFSEEERYKLREQGAGSREQGAGSREQGFGSIPLHDTSRFDPKQHRPVPSPFFDRLSLLIGNDGLKKLQKTHVIVFGAGGVGSWCAEALVRSGIGKIGIIDFDRVCESNVNRQVQATGKTIGQAKVDVLKKRLSEINPECEITAYNKLFCRENAGLFNIKNADYVIDAIDTVTHKLDLIETVCTVGVTLFSSMGMALRMDISRIKTASIWKTDVCPLARLVRQGLRKRGFTKDFTVVYSDEQIKNESLLPNPQPPFPSKKINGSIVTVTASAGLKLASLVINDVLQDVLL